MTTGRGKERISISVHVSILAENINLCPYYKDENDFPSLLCEKNLLPIPVRKNSLFIPFKHNINTLNNKIN